MAPRPSRTQPRRSTRTSLRAAEMSSGSGAPTGAPVTRRSRPVRAGRRQPSAPGATGVGLIVTYGLLIVFNGLALWGLLRAIDQESGSVSASSSLAQLWSTWSTPRDGSSGEVPRARLDLPRAVRGVPRHLHRVPVLHELRHGHLITKNQAVAQIEANSLQASPDATRYRADIMQTPDGELYLLLTDPNGAYFTGQSGTLEPADVAQVQTSRAAGSRPTATTSRSPSPRRATCRTPTRMPSPSSTGHGAGPNSQASPRPVSSEQLRPVRRRPRCHGRSTVHHKPSDASVEGTFTNLESSPPDPRPGRTIGLEFDNPVQGASSPDPASAASHRFQGSVFVWIVVFSTLTVAVNFAPRDCCL